MLDGDGAAMRKAGPMRVGYARVSTDDQNLAGQLDELRATGCADVYAEHGSGKKDDRPELANALRTLRTGDTLVVTRLDRLGRNLPHLIATVNALAKCGVGFESLAERLDTTSAGGELIFHIFASMAQFERRLDSERTKAGLPRALLAASHLAQTSTDGVSRMESPVYWLGPGLGSGPDRGCIFGQPKLLSGHLMDDLSGYAPVLVAEANLARSCSEAERIKVVSTDEAPGLTAELAGLQSRAALVRPDRYILATANEDTELKAILSAPDLGGLFARFPVRGSESVKGPLRNGRARAAS